MDVTLDTYPVKDLSALAAAVANPAPALTEAAMPVLSGANVRVSEAPADLEALMSRLRMETNEARVNAVRSRLAAVLGRLADMSEENAKLVGEMASVGRELAEAEKTRDAESAKMESGGGREAYEAAEKAVSGLQAKLERLIESLDAAGLLALREAIRLDLGDVEHLHDEIEKKDGKNKLDQIRAVEDVIADALDRLEGKIADEVEDRHLDHV